jgi:hypothetical protein
MPNVHQMNQIHQTQGPFQYRAVPADNPVLVHFRVVLGDDTVGIVRSLRSHVVPVGNIGIVHCRAVLECNPELGHCHAILAYKLESAHYHVELAGNPALVDLPEQVHGNLHRVGISDVYLRSLDLARGHCMSEQAH